MTGFEHLVLPWLALLRPGQRMVVAGGMSDALRRRLADSGLGAALDGRLVLLGRVNDLALSALIENAVCLLLPFESDGGSNLETAEALLSDRPVVASPASMRGFAECRNLPGVAVAKSPSAFGAVVRFALESVSQAPRNPSSTDPLTWDARLAPLVALVAELTDSDRARTTSPDRSSTAGAAPDRLVRAADGAVTTEADRVFPTQTA